jgi:hypothetical protein
METIRGMTKKPNFVQKLMGAFSKENGVTGVGGQGFNPSQGGTPPAVAAPEMTPEVVKGKSKIEDQ